MCVLIVYAQIRDFIQKRNKCPFCTVLSMHIVYTIGYLMCTINVHYWCTKSTQYETYVHMCILIVYTNIIGCLQNCTKCSLVLYYIYLWHALEFSQPCCPLPDLFVPLASRPEPVIVHQEGARVIHLDGGQVFEGLKSFAIYIYCVSNYAGPN